MAQTGLGQNWPSLCYEVAKWVDVLNKVAKWMGRTDWNTDRVDGIPLKNRKRDIPDVKSNLEKLEESLEESEAIERWRGVKEIGNRRGIGAISN
ncbi:hypothetical protein L1987_70996 [Smallanthus sonchifolius]|uniref:Uncharacterized protein n=1 Tax=Smallanthus sonchifolius TaxID=185202 RepID=A0ACB9AS24_9ASTR|nr:hypothetical protein L1987_70996 [Smallanthus sonchifolius]